MENTVPNEIIKEIAQLIDSGDVVYLHISTHELLSYPDSDEEELDYLKQEVFDVVDMDPDAYLVFKPLHSSDAYQIMVNFAEQVTDAQQKSSLHDALNARKPFRVFRDKVDDLGLTDQWYDFKEAYLKVLIQDQITSASEQ
jgi:hypothetical protein